MPTGLPEDQKLRHEQIVAFKSTQHPLLQCPTTSIFTFNPLQTSHGKEYSSNGLLDSSALNVSPTSNTVMLTWTQQSDNVVDIYCLKGEYSCPCMDFNDSEVIHHNITGTTRDIALTGLQAFNNYSFSLTAINRVRSESVFFSFTTN